MTRVSAKVPKPAAAPARSPPFPPAPTAEPIAHPAARTIAPAATMPRESLPGEPVTVEVSGPQLSARPARRSFEWNGEQNMLNFLVSVAPEAPHGPTQICFEVFIEGMSINHKPVAVYTTYKLAIGSTLRQLADAAEAAGGKVTGMYKVKGPRVPDGFEAWVKSLDSGAAV